jgi:hypothetical protein
MTHINPDFFERHRQIYVANDTISMLSRAICPERLVGRKEAVTRAREREPGFDRTYIYIYSSWCFRVGFVCM